MLTAQSLAVPEGSAAPALRDPFSVEIITPESTYFAPIAGTLATWPCFAPINDGYGDRDGGFHYGVDIMCPYGTPLVAAAGGVVEVVEEGGGGWGTYVKIAHGDGIATLYSHMVSGSPTVAIGDIVEAGQVIGATGQTGYATAPHCHFEVWVGGERVDPRPWLP
jgi:murein DD-endopeptidase MepM/ murein hydrolase activator NlpD